MGIILASKSPRRKELLGLMGLDFNVLTADIDEAIDTSLPIEREIARLSADKAATVANKVGKSDIVISADTVVVDGNTVMGKPKDEAEAYKMLRALSGKTHRVITGVTVAQGERVLTKTVVTEIAFRVLSDTEIKAYIATGDPMDKAGAYGIQGKAAAFVSEIRGDYFSVVGLPVCTLTLMLREFQVEI